MPRTMPTSTTIETERLLLRELVPGDSAFILALLSEPAFLEHIGDKGVRTLGDARAYIRQGAMASYAEHGHGLLLVLRREDRAPMGICGLLRRETLPEPDLGFAFRRVFWSRGYALEAASAVLAHARETLGLGRVLAITSPGNEASIRLLTKLGFHAEGEVRLEEGGGEVRLFALELGDCEDLTELAGRIRLAEGFDHKAMRELRRV